MIFDNDHSDGWDRYERDNVIPSLAAFGPIRVPALIVAT